MTVLCVVQARTGSTRLPGKVLAPVGGRPLLRFMLDRLAGLAGAAVGEIVVATSALDRDDPVVAVARAAGRPVVRGPEDDVLARFAAVLDRHPAEHVVRLTADCPLADPGIVAAVVAHHRDTGADYTCNVLPRTFPKGLDVEVARVDAMRVAIAEAADPAEREHVMPFLYRRPERFRLANLRHTEPLGDLRWTVDTADDLAFVRAVVDAIGGDGRFPWTTALPIAGHRGAEPAPDAVVLQPAVATDAGFVLACRNDPDAVRHSVTGRPVRAAEHAAWFATRLEDPAGRIWVGSLAGRPIGTVRIQVEAGIAEVGIAVAPGERGRGRGRALLTALLAELAGDQQVVTLAATVHPDNAASRRLFEGAGFADRGEREGFRVLHRGPAVPMRTS